MPFLFNFDPNRNLDTLAIDKCDLKEHGFLDDTISRVPIVLLYSSACVANRFSFRYDPSRI